jgi:O-antigen ligase
MREFRLLPILLAGYLFLLIFRPYEYWPILGELRIERVYMLFFMTIVFFSKEKRFLSNPINGAVILFSIALLLSGIFSMNWDESWKVIEDYLKYVVFYFMVILCIRDEIDFRFIIMAFIGVMFLYVGKSAWEFFVNGRHIYRMGIPRMIGIDVTYGDPNSFSATICYSLPLAWAMVRSFRDMPRIRRLVIAYCLLALVAIISTGSRSGMITAILFLVMISLGAARKFTVLSFVIVILVGSWAFMPEYLQTRFLSAFMDDVGPASAQESAHGRMVGFMHGMRLFAENPILGVGPNIYPLTWPGIERGTNAHNIWAQLLGELGIVGGVSFVMLVMFIFLQHIAIIKSYNNSIAILKKVSSSKTCFSVSDCNKKYLKTCNNSLFNFFDYSFFHYCVSVAIIQTLIIMLFKGWSDHNLYRYTWHFIAAITVTSRYIYNMRLK